jgi:hypothetical protein
LLMFPPETQLQPATPEDKTSQPQLLFGRI